MFSKKLEIENIPNLRVLIHSNLDELTIVLEEKKNYKWFPILKKEYNGMTVENFDFTKIIEEVVAEFSQKRVVEEHIENILGGDGMTTIVLPNVEVD